MEVVTDRRAGPHYVAGDHWVICDRCGFQYRRSQTFKTWDNLIVCSEDFETRHPQDFVRGRTDTQNVPNARPEQIINLIGPLTTMLTAEVAPGSVSLDVESSTRFESGDRIGIACESETVVRYVDGIVSATNITITQALGTTARAGASVVNYSAISEPDIG